MSSSESPGEQIERKRSISTDEPAVGLIATRGNGPEIAAAVLRAHAKGHQAVVAASLPNAEGIEYAKLLGAMYIEVPQGLEPTAVEEHLVQKARDTGFPGLVIQQDPENFVDYETSFELLQETRGYAVAAEPLPTVDEGLQILAAIPAYNEEQAISDVVRAAREQADEVLVIDDGSTDATVETSESAGATVIEHSTNKGYGGALKTAFREAKRADVDHLVVLDGDGQHDPREISRLIDTQVNDGVDIVIGSRFEHGSETNLPIYRRLGLRVVNELTNLSMGVVRRTSRVSDTQSGFRAYNQDAISSLAKDTSIGNQMGASTDILHHAHRHNLSIEEVGTTVNYDVENASSQNAVSHGLHLVSNILRTIEYERPVSVLGVPGFFSTLIGVAFGYLTFANYIDSGTFPLGLAITSVFFALAGTFACFTAIILHSLNQHSIAAKS